MIIVLFFGIIYILIGFIIVRRELGEDATLLIGMVLWPVFIYWKITDKYFKN